MKIIGLAGSPSPLSRTRLIVQAAIERIGVQAGAHTRLVDLAQLVPDLGFCARSEAPARVEEALRLIETADLLIAGTPVYKGSYPGLFKHLIDLIGYPALLGTPAGLLATGGSERSALVVEYQLRPLFTFFGAKTLPTAVFIPDKAIAGGWVDEAACGARLDQMIAEAVRELKLARETRVSAAV